MSNQDLTMSEKRTKERVTYSHEGIITMNISDRDGPLSTNIIIVLIADEIIKADQTARRK